MKKYIVYRKDISSNDIVDVDDLFRLTVKDNILLFDSKKNLKGRGIYLKKDRQAIEDGIKKLSKRYRKQNLELLKEQLIENL